MEIVIPKSKLLDVKSMIVGFNSQLKKHGLPPIASVFSEPFTKKWFVSELTFEKSKWKSLGVKKDVALISIKLGLDVYDAQGVEFHSYINTDSVVFDPLSAKVTECKHVAFTKTPFELNDVGDVFSHDGSVICSKCSVVRNRQSVFQCIDKKTGLIKPVSYSCLDGDHALSQQKLVMWHGYYKHVFQKLIADIQSESRIRLVLKQPKPSDVFGINSFVSMVREQIFVDGSFYSTKFINSTSSIVLKNLQKGCIGTIYKDIARYHDYMSSFMPKPGFEYNVKRAYYNAKKNGVGQSNAALIAASYVLYRSKCPDLAFEDEPLYLGFYSGIIVPFLVDKKSVYFRDAFGRVFITSLESVSDSVNSGDVLLVKAIVDDLVVSNGRLIHKLNSIEQFTL